jgi:hypothetical protein
MMKNLFAILIGMLCFAVTSSTIWAGECVEGKSPVQINLPNGMQKTICLNDSALPGLQNAADHSDGTIVPTTCPCWNETDMKYYLDNKIKSASSPFYKFK